MKYCKKCEVSIDSPVQRCPLCYATLTPKDDHPESPAYPDLAEAADKYSMMFRILLFLSLSVSVVCLTINLLTFREMWWSLIVIVNITYMWAAIGTALRRHSKIGFIIMVQVIALAALLILLDFLIGTAVHWSLEFALPALFFCATLSISIIVIVKRMVIRDFILYFILTALLGFIPLLLVLTGMVTYLWPSVSCVIYSVLSLASIFIFAHNTTKIELKKRFHI